jgi:DNA invertase Pin-like site-specific DNA recombinase
MIPRPTSGTPIALYARVSTKEGKQHLDNQLGELRSYARRMRWRIAGEYTDQITGTSEKRPGLDELFSAAAGKLFDIVLVFDLSRMTRNGPASAFAQIERLKSAGVEFWSLREEQFRTPTAGPLLIAIAAYLAQQERAAISDRVRAGLARAKAAGVVLGRRKAIVNRDRIARLRAEGVSIRNIAKKLKCSRGSVERALKKAAQIKRSLAEEGFV